ACGDGCAAVNGTLVFAARDENGCELWRSDGVTADLLMDINPGPGSSMWRRFGVVAQFRSVSGLVLFSAYDDAHGFELWATDGTSNTGMVEDIAVGPGWSSEFLHTGRVSRVFHGERRHDRHRAVGDLAIGHSPGAESSPAQSRSLMGKRVQVEQGIEAVEAVDRR